MKAFQFFNIFFRQFPWQILTNTLILIFGGLVDAACVLSLAPVVDLLINPGMQNLSYITKQVVGAMVYFGIAVTLGKVLLVFFLFNVVRSMMSVLSRYFILRTQYAVLRRLFIGVFEDFFNARWYFFSSQKQGTLLNTFQREMTVVGEACSAMARFFALIVQCIMFLVVPFLVSWKITAISLTSGFLLAIPFRMFGKVAYRFGRMNTATANRFGEILQQSVSSAKVILGFGNIRNSVTSAADAFDAHIRATVKSQTLNTALSDFHSPFGILILIITIAAGRSLVVPLSEIAIILFSFLRILPIISGIVANRNAVDSFLPSYEQVMHLRKRALELKQETGAMPFRGFKQEMVIEDLTFAYPGHEAVLKNINVRIPKGRMVAFVGGSGAGKSTLIDVIMGFNEPSSGRIMVDGVDLNNFDITSYRKRIGYVPQDSILFNMSIRDNMLWAKDDATDDEIESACSQAHASEFIESFPHGYNTLVGDRGVRLSGGQIQRVALARALLRKPDILILDEATSSLDTHSERLIQQAIDAIARQTTVIVIAHRLSTVVNADYIYVLDKGRVVEDGTYAQLADGPGPFHRMLSLQSLNNM